MKFMLIMQGSQSDWEKLSSWPPEKFKAHIDFMLTLNKELTASGELAQANGLDIPNNAKIVRAHRADAPTVTDGPFPESKEFLAGFWIVDVETPQRAFDIAARASTAPGPDGKPLAIPVEVRQVMCAPNVEA